MYFFALSVGFLHIPRIRARLDKQAVQVEPVSKVSQFQFYDYFSDQSPDHHKFAIPLLSIIHISNFNQVTSYNMNMYNSIVASFGLIITLGQGLGLPNPQTKNA